MNTMNDTIRPLMKTEIVEELGTSPKPLATSPVFVPTIDFPRAIEQIMIGKMITRVEWNDVTEYAIMKDGWLMIHTKGQDHLWSISEADMRAEDWKLV